MFKKHRAPRAEGGQRSPDGARHDGKLSLTGMCCSGQVQRVERMVLQQPGVVDAWVTWEVAEVSFDPAVTSLERLARAIERSFPRVGVVQDDPSA